MMLMARHKAVMGDFIISRRSAALGWAATTVMAVIVIAMFATWGRT